MNWNGKRDESLPDLRAIAAAREKAALVPSAPSPPPDEPKTQTKRQRRRPDNRTPRMRVRSAQPEVEPTWQFEPAYLFVLVIAVLWVLGSMVK